MVTAPTRPPGGAPAFHGLWDPAEIHWSIGGPDGDGRPLVHRAPVPRAGSRCLFRMDPFGPLTDALVERVQDRDDFADHYLWHVIRKDNGEALLDELGNYQLKPAPDPWPTLWLRTDWGPLSTREGRVRGAQGWWPLDWRHRFYPGPGARYLVRDIDNARAPI